MEIKILILHGIYILTIFLSVYRVAQGSAVVDGKDNVGRRNHSLHKRTYGVADRGVFVDYYANTPLAGLAPIPPMDPRLHHHKSYDALEDEPHDDYDDGDGDYDDDDYGHHGDDDDYDDDDDGDDDYHDSYAANHAKRMQRLSLVHHLRDRAALAARLLHERFDEQRLHQYNLDLSTRALTSKLSNYQHDRNDELLFKLGQLTEQPYHQTRQEFEGIGPNLNNLPIYGHVGEMTSGITYGDVLNNRGNVHDLERLHDMNEHLHSEELLRHAEFNNPVEAEPMEARTPEVAASLAASHLQNHLLQHPDWNLHPTVEDPVAVADRATYSFSPLAGDISRASTQATAEHLYHKFATMDDNLINLASSSKFMPMGDTVGSNDNVASVERTSGNKEAIAAASRSMRKPSEKTIKAFVKQQPKKKKAETTPTKKAKIDVSHRQKKNHKQIGKAKKENLLRNLKMPKISTRHNSKLIKSPSLVAAPSQRGTVPIPDFSVIKDADSFKRTLKKLDRIIDLLMSSAKQRKAVKKTKTKTLYQETNAKSRSKAATVAKQNGNLTINPKEASSKSGNGKSEKSDTENTKPTTVATTTTSTSKQNDSLTSNAKEEPETIATNQNVTTNATQTSPESQTTTAIVTKQNGNSTTNPTEAAKRVKVKEEIKKKYTRYKQYLRHLRGQTQAITTLVPEDGYIAPTENVIPFAFPKHRMPTKSVRITNPQPEQANLQIPQFSHFSTSASKNHTDEETDSRRNQRTVRNTTKNTTNLQKSKLLNGGKTKSVRITNPQPEQENLQIPQFSHLSTHASKNHTDEKAGSRINQRSVGNTTKNTTNVEENKKNQLLNGGNTDSEDISTGNADKSNGTLKALVNFNTKSGDEINSILQVSASSGKSNTTNSDETNATLQASVIENRRLLEEELENKQERYKKLRMKAKEEVLSIVKLTPDSVKNQQPVEKTTNTTTENTNPTSENTNNEPENFNATNATNTTQAVVVAFQNPTDAKPITKSTPSKPSTSTDMIADSDFDPSDIDPNDTVDIDRDDTATNSNRSKSNSDPELGTEYQNILSEDGSGAVPDVDSDDRNFKKKQKFLSQEKANSSEQSGVGHASKHGISEADSGAVTDDNDVDSAYSEIHKNKTHHTSAEKQQSIFQEKINSFRQFSATNGDHKIHDGSSEILDDRGDIDSTESDTKRNETSRLDREEGSAFKENLFTQSAAKEGSGEIENDKRDIDPADIVGIKSSEASNSDQEEKLVFQEKINSFKKFSASPGDNEKNANLSKKTSKTDWMW